MIGSIAKPNRPMSARKAKLEAQRRRFLINELSRMGSEGWHKFKASEYLPLEAELRLLMDSLSRRGHSR